MDKILDLSCVGKEEIMGKCLADKYDVKSICSKYFTGEYEYQQVDYDVDTVTNTKKIFDRIILGVFNTYRDEDYIVELNKVIKGKRYLFGVYVGDVEILIGVDKEKKIIYWKNIIN